MSKTNSIIGMFFIGITMVATVLLIAGAIYGAILTPFENLKLQMGLWAFALFLGFGLNQMAKQIKPFIIHSFGLNE